ncbi:MAG: hypothetical protein IPK10_14905 [Bacteroidetes bacterium]|nr:hypothetical protein [Bacteroidota bacterium]
MRKCYFFVLVLLLSSLELIAQNVGINNPTPHASAICDMVSTDKGILIPRLTSAQRVAIVAPAVGLLVCDLTGAKFMYFDGVVWQSVGGAVNAWGLMGMQEMVPQILLVLPTINPSNSKLIISGVVI